MLALPRPQHSVSSFPISTDRLTFTHILSWGIIRKQAAFGSLLGSVQDRTIEVGVPMNPHVKSVCALDDFELEVLFENGESRRFDVKPYLERGIFVRLRDHTLFQAARVVAGSVEWPAGLDLSYDTLYLEGKAIAAPAHGAER
jgi:hypothetical protein